MEFWLKQGRWGAFQLPVKPSEFNVTVAHRNTVVNVVKVGDINLIGNTGLREVSLSSFFPAKAYNFSFNRSKIAPILLVNRIEYWRRSGKPIRVIITGLLNMEATIESFTWGQKDGTGDIYYTLNLKEYKKVKVRKIAKKTSTVKPTTRAVKPPTPKAEGGTTKRTYTVQRGDCLWAIAKKFYGNGSQYPKIANANKDKSKNPNLIFAGQVLTIP